MSSVLLSFSFRLIPKKLMSSYTGRCYFSSFQGDNSTELITINTGKRIIAILK